MRSWTRRPKNELAERQSVGTAPLGAALWGQLDLAGEVWAWDLDWSAAYVPCVDCGAFTPSLGRVMRGGNFHDSLSTMYPTDFLANAPTARDTGYGFRCART